MTERLNWTELNWNWSFTYFLWFLISHVLLSFLRFSQLYIPNLLLNFNFISNNSSTLRVFWMLFSHIIAFLFYEYSILPLCDYISFIKAFLSLQSLYPTFFLVFLFTLFHISHIWWPLTVWIHYKSVFMWLGFSTVEALYKMIYVIYFIRKSPVIIYFPLELVRFPREDPIPSFQHLEIWLRKESWHLVCKVSFILLMCIIVSLSSAVFDVPKFRNLLSFSSTKMNKTSVFC